VKGHLRVLVWYRAGAEADIAGGHAEIARSLAGVPGLVSAELHRSRTDPESFLVISEWSDQESFDRWERGAEHKGQTSPLRPYLDRTRVLPYEIHEVVG
jgi:heme-degrading monooxygenase HmoA